MKYRGVIFDLDGTLVHTIEDIGDAANELFRRHGYPSYTIQDFIQWIGNGAAKFIQNGIGQELPQEQLLAYVQEFKGIYRENLNNKSVLFEGIGDLLDQLVALGVHISILSNKPHHLTLEVTRHYLSQWPIHPVFGQREEVPRKPDPAAAIEIAHMLHFPPEEILFVGDSAGDMWTADAAGMKPVGVSWGYGNPAVPDLNGKAMLIQKPSELLSLI